MLFRLHNLLVIKVADMQRKKVLNQANLKDIGVELGQCLTESARILLSDHGCPPQLIQAISMLKCQTK